MAVGYTYTRATEASGPGTVESDGKGVAAQAGSTSVMLLPAGNCAETLVRGLEIGMTSEQSTIEPTSWPSCVSARKINWKSLVSLSWLSAVLCQ